jgi:hypothetical protein
MASRDPASTEASRNTSAREDGRHTSGYVISISHAAELDFCCCVHCSSSLSNDDVVNVGEGDGKADVLGVGFTHAVRGASLENVFVA